MIHQVKKLIKFSVSKRLIILKLHVLLTCFCDLKNSISACVSLSSLGDKFELDGGFHGFLTLKIISFSVRRDEYKRTLGTRLFT